MADYSTIKGFTVETLSSDPYTSIAGAGTWAAGNNMNTTRSRLAGCGISTSGLGIAGVNGGPQVDNVEKFNGSTWTEIADVNTAREAGAAGGRGRRDGRAPRPVGGRRNQAGTCPAPHRVHHHPVGHDPGTA